MKILSAKFLKSGALLEHCPEGDRPEYAFIGRSNVGKSSLINAICRRKTLVQTSPKPGKTQLMNFFDIQSSDDKDRQSSWYLVDLPGYGYARVSKDKRAQFEDMIIDYLTKRENLTQIFVLIDIRLKPQQIDLEFVTWLSIQDRPYCLVFTKSDKATQKEISTNLKAFVTELSKTVKTLPGYYITSAVKSGATKEIEDLIDQMNKS
jgi:GTP-binding protein